MSETTTHHLRGGHAVVEHLPGACVEGDWYWRAYRPDGQVVAASADPTLSDALRRAQLALDGWHEPPRRPTRRVVKTIVVDVPIE